MTGGLDVPTPPEGRVPRGTYAARLRADLAAARDHIADLEAERTEVFRALLPLFTDQEVDKLLIRVPVLAELVVARINAVQASRQDWAVEAMRLDIELSARPTVWAYEAACEALEKRRVALVAAMGLPDGSGFYEAVEEVEELRASLRRPVSEGVGNTPIPDDWARQLYEVAATRLGRTDEAATIAEVSADLVRSWLGSAVTNPKADAESARCDLCGGTGIVPPDMFGRDADGAPWVDEDQPCPNRCMTAVSQAPVEPTAGDPKGDASLIDQIREFRLRNSPPIPTVSEHAIQRILSAATDLPVDALFAVTGGVPQADEVWRVGRDEALLVWVRKVFDDGAADVVPLVLDVELADEATLLVPADATPVGVELAAMTALRTHVDIKAFLNRVCALDISTEVDEVMEASRSGRAPVGVRVGPPILDDADRRIEYRAAIRDVLAPLSPGGWAGDPVPATSGVGANRLFTGVTSATDTEILGGGTGLTALRARLRVLVADLQGNTRTGKEQGLPNGIAYDNGFSDGQIQAGNDLELLLDEFGVPQASSTPPVGGTQTPAQTPVVPDLGDTQ